MWVWLSLHTFNWMSNKLTCQHRTPHCSSVGLAWPWQGPCRLSNPSEQRALGPSCTIKSPKGTVTQPNSRQQTHAEVFQTQRPAHEKNMMPWWWGGVSRCLMTDNPSTWYGGGRGLCRLHNQISTFPNPQVCLGPHTGGARQVRNWSWAHRHHTQVGTWLLSIFPMYIGFLFRGFTQIFLSVLHKIHPSPWSADISLW